LVEHGLTIEGDKEKMSDNEHRGLTWFNHQKSSRMDAVLSRIGA
jgi:hypothetical protein